jgi:hypothetical protein
VEGDCAPSLAARSGAICGRAAVIEPLVPDMLGRGLSSGKQPPSPASRMRSNSILATDLVCARKSKSSLWHQRPWLTQKEGRLDADGGGGGLHVRGFLVPREKRKTPLSSVGSPHFLDEVVTARLPRRKRGDQHGEAPALACFRGALGLPRAVFSGVSVGA